MHPEEFVREITFSVMPAEHRACFRMPFPSKTREALTPRRKQTFRVMDFMAVFSV
jgi:hypothetical protein